jgi:putative transposase
MCQVLNVARSGYYAWTRRISHSSRRQIRRKELIVRIRHSHHSSRQTYGSPRVLIDLHADDVKVSRNTVAKYMRQEGIRARRPRRFVPRTTDSQHDQPIAGNVLNRQFTRATPNEGWVSDITYLPTEQGWLYLAVVIDLYSRRVVGHAMAEHLRSSLALDALGMALDRRRLATGNRRRDRGLLLHSDRGVQYAAGPYRAVLEAHGIEPSMSRKGNCYDNAVAESFFATLKGELTHREHYRTRAQARQSVFEWIEVFYNRQRRHSALNYLSPAEFENQQAVA